VIHQQQFAAYVGPGLVAINAIPSTYRFPASRNRNPKHCTNGDRKPYDEATYVESVRRRGSPTIEKL